MSTPIESGYASINGLELYYEIHGSGEPLVLLHGGIAASEMFGENLPLLAESRKVIAVHLQGHGHTRDIDRPLRQEHMADDVAALIGHLGFEKADVMGYSMGGGVALQMAIRHPEVVNRLIVISRAITRNGWYPEVREAFDHMADNAALIGAQVKQSQLAKVYPDVDWENSFRKVGDMGTQEYDWMEAVAAITSPILFVFADADAIRLEHIFEMYALFGGGQRNPGLDGSGRARAQLAIVPGATHYDILSTTVVGTLANRFLDT